MMTMNLKKTGLETAITGALDALCDVAACLPVESKTRTTCVNAELNLRDALDRARSARVPYAWEVKQGNRTFFVSTEEFNRSTYDTGSFRALYE